MSIFYLVNDIFVRSRYHLCITVEINHLNRYNYNKRKISLNFFNIITFLKLNPNSKPVIKCYLLLTFDLIIL